MCLMVVAGYWSFLTSSSLGERVTPHLSTPWFNHINNKSDDFCLFVLFVAVIGILINPTSNAARGILIANVLIVTMNIVQLEEIFVS